ncbi:nitroreductase family protein [Urechidicola sp. KH5]
MVEDHILVNGFKHVKHKHNSFEQLEMIERAESYHRWLDSRRSVREYTDKPVPKAVIEQLLLSASTAPSGAHKQPWTFCAVSSPEIKTKIREAAEAEERESYSHRMSDRWKKDLAPLGTDASKPFLEIAPWLIVVFKRVYEFENGVKHNNYYVNESVGIASGMLISAIHNAGLVTLTHTPSPMNFLGKVLDRPSNERPFLLLPVGYPKEPIYVPSIERKGIEDISVFYE